MISREKKKMMITKTKKKKKIGVKRTETHSTDKESEKRNLWPNLPQQLIKLIAKNSSMMKDLYSKGVTKSWRTQSTKCRSNSLLTPPWLQLSTADSGSDHTDQSHTFNIPFKVGHFWYYCRERPDLPIGYHFLGCSQGLLVAKRASDSTDYTLLEPYPCSGGWNVPPWDDQVPFLSAALSSYPLTTENRRSNKAKSIVMVLTGISHLAFVYRRIWEGQGWIKKDSDIVDPHCSDPNQPNHLIRLSNGIWFKGKFYALSLQGTVAVIEDIDSDLRITAIGKRLVPSVASMHYRECMIESGGNILILFLISRISVNKVDFVEVYQLDTADLSWIKKQSLEDLTVFLSVHCCIGVSARRVGCKRNCVYFSICSTNGWWVYDMETCIITPTQFLDWVDPEN